MIILNAIVTSRNEGDPFEEEGGIFFPLMQFRENDLLYSIVPEHNIPISITNMRTGGSSFEFGSAMITEGYLSQVITVGVCPYQDEDKVSELVNDIVMFSDEQDCYVPDELVVIPGAKLVFDKLKEISNFKVLPLSEISDKLKKHKKLNK